jgi:O-6-methylguanine DNA methyltransferase
MTLHSSTISTPIGPLTYLYGEDKKVYGVFFDTQANLVEKYLEKNLESYTIKQMKKGLYDQDFKKYFKDAKHSLQTIPIAVIGTEAQITIWNTVGKIKSGQVARYKDIAKKIGNEKAVRSVGTAIGANPVCLIVPCHRVLASDGSLGGYSGGLDKKEWLLKHEGVLQ